MTQTIDGLGIALPVPPGWQDRTQLIMVSEQGETFRANLVLVREAQRGRSMETHLEAHLETLRETFEGFELVVNRAARIGAYDGHIVDYRFSAAGTEYRQRQFTVITNEFIYTFTYSDLADGFEDTVGVMEYVVGGSQITGTDNGGGDGFLS